MGTSQGGLWSDSFGAVGATLKALQDAGITPEHLAALRSDRGLANAVARLIKQKTVSPSFAEKQLGFLEPGRFFGPTDWVKIFGIEISEFVASPGLLSRFNLREVLDGPCPFVVGKTVKETHYFFYLPPNFDGKPLTLKTWQRIFPETGEFCFSAYMDSGAWFRDYDFAKEGLARWSWYLMFEGVVPGSGSKTWEEQLAFKPQGYEIPSLVECVPLYLLTACKNGSLRRPFGYGRTDDFTDFTRVEVGFSTKNLDVNQSPPIQVSPSIGLFLFRKLYD